MRATYNILLRIYLHRLRLCILLFLVTGLLLYAAPVADEKKENKPTIPVYNQLSKLRFSQQPIPVPAKGITLRWENASWFLEKGFLHLMEPTPGGRVTGLIFKGKGHFLMSIPDVVEREHLVRCTGKNIFDEIVTYENRYRYEPHFTADPKNFLTLAHIAGRNNGDDRGDKIKDENAIVIES